jgi:hypothetical protein
MKTILIALIKTIGILMSLLVLILLMAAFTKTMLAIISFMMVFSIVYECERSRKMRGL